MGIGILREGCEMFVLTTRLRKKRAILVGALVILLIAGGL